MQDLILYLGITAVGYFIGKKLDRHIGWLGKVQTASVYVLVLFMGMRMGANREITDNLSVIGLSAVVFTVFSLLFTLLLSTAARRLLGVDRYAHTGTAAESGKKDTESSGSGINKMTVFIFIAVVIGIAVGFFAVRRLVESGLIFGGKPEGFDSFAGTVIRVGLCILLIFVGMDLGLEGTIADDIRRAGLRILVFPFVSAAGALLGAFLAGLIMRMDSHESLAIGAGLGWYTLAPGIIMDAGHIQASAVCFLHNVMREIVSILIIPLVARKVGYVECCGLAGAAGMDVCLPIVERATNTSAAVYCFVSGVIMTILVPVLVPLLI